MNPHPVKAIRWSAKVLLLELSVLEQATASFEDPIPPQSPLALWLHYNEFKMALVQVGSSRIMQTLVVSFVFLPGTRLYSLVLIYISVTTVIDW